MRNIFFLFTFSFSLLTSMAQVSKAPAYPLITHDPYFSIWSFSDKLNESTTKHWTGKDHSLIGMLSVDGKLYKFLGEPARELKAIVPGADFQSYTCQFTETKPVGDWTAIEYDDSKWQSGKGMFGTKDVDPQTVWTSREIWIRRTFEGQPANIHELLLQAKYDDNVEIYLNGEKIFNAGCCSANKDILLSKEIEQKLRKGKNVLAMYCENTGGQAYIDAGLYDRLPPQPMQQAVQKSVSITATQTKYELNCGPVFLAVNFLSPLIASDLDILSRPVSYISFNVMSTDGKEHDVKLYLLLSDDLVRNTAKTEVKKEILQASGLSYIKTGTISQPLLKTKGDNVRIDWGYSYVAVAKNEKNKQTIGSAIKGLALPGVSTTEINYGKIKNIPVEENILLAYDDINSIQYFNQKINR
jgi:Domain of unknown function (DUF5127)/Domain of unknown function (DUF4964)